MNRLLWALFLVLVSVLFVYGDTTYSTIQFRRGPVSQLPATGRMGEPLFSTDTHQLFLGYSTGTKEVAFKTDIPAPLTSTDQLPEGSVNQYYTAARARADASPAYIVGAGITGFTNLSTAVATLGVNPATLQYATNQTVNKLTIPANIELKSVNGAIITVNSGKTLTINGQLENNGIITGGGNVSITGSYTGSGLITNTGTVLFPAGATVNASTFGFSTSIANNSTVLQKAINALSTGVSGDVTRGGKVDLGSGGSYAFLSGITLPTNVALGGNNVTFNFTGLTSGTAIAVVATVNMLNAVTTPVSGINLIGPGSTHTVNGFWFGGTGTYAVHCGIRDVNISSFTSLISVSTNTWCLNFTHCAIGNYGTGSSGAYGYGLNIQPSGSNYGEAYTFDNCTFYGTYQVFYNQAPFADVYCNNCQFDYNMAVVYSNNNFNLFIRGGHIESDGDSISWFRSYGSSAYSNFHLSDCYVLFSKAAGMSNYFFQADANYATLSLSNVTWGAPWHYLPLRLQSNGRVIQNGISAENNIYIFTGSMLNDGQFNGSTIVDWTPLVGHESGAVTPTIDTGTGHLAINSLKFLGTSGVWAQCSRQFNVMQPGILMIRFWYKTSGTVDSTNQFRVLVQSVNTYGGGNNWWAAPNPIQTAVGSTWTVWTYAVMITNPGLYQLELASYGNLGTFWIDDMDVQLIN